MSADRDIERRGVHGETCSGARNLPGFLCSLLQPGPVLVLGASELVLETSKRHDVTVVEWSQERVSALDELARARGRQIRVSLRDPAREDLGLPSRSFPNVVCLDVLERCPDDVAVLEKLHRVLEAEGRLIVRVPARPWSTGAAQGAAGVRRYDPDSLRGALEEASFRTLRLRHWNLLGVPSALMEGRRGEPSGSRRRAGGSSGARSWWDSTIDLWYRAVEKRVGFPAGVSLVAIATPHLEKSRVRRPSFARPLGGPGHRVASEPMAAAR